MKMMKTFLFVLAAFVLPMCVSTASAQLFQSKSLQGRLEAKAYMQGAVTEENGEVVFSQDIEVPLKTKAQIMTNLQRWASLRYLAESSQGVWTDNNYFKNYEHAQVAKVDAQSTPAVIECKADEELIFTNKTLSKDYSRLNYTLTLRIQDGKVSVRMTDIVYTYNLTDQAQRIKAEDWITDSEAFSKKGQLLRNVAKFRIKTIDLKDELMKEIKEEAAR